jgi:hypothetical protein
MEAHNRDRSHNQVLGAFLGERERFGWNAALIVTVGGFKDFGKWSR